MVYNIKGLLKRRLSLKGLSLVELLISLMILATLWSVVFQNRVKTKTINDYASKLNHTAKSAKISKALLESYIPSIKTTKTYQENFETWLLNSMEQQKGYYIPGSNIIDEGFYESNRILVELTDLRSEKYAEVAVIDTGDEDLPIAITNVFRLYKDIPMSIK